MQYHQVLAPPPPPPFLETTNSYKNHLSQTREKLKRKRNNNLEKAGERKEFLIKQRQHDIQSRLLQRSLQSRQAIQYQKQQRQIFMQQVLKLLTFLDFELLIHVFIRMREEFDGVRRKMILFNFKASVIQRVMRAYLVKKKILGIDAKMAKRAMK